MPKEFQYKQRKTTDSYRKGWEKVFSAKDTCPLCDDESDNHYWHTECCRNLAETTEQKQPLVTNPSTE